MDIEKQILGRNKLGLHARAGAKLVKEASAHPVDIQIGQTELMVNAKSIMGILMLAAAQGTELTLRVEGESAEACEAAVQGIDALFANLFGEGE